MGVEFLDCRAQGHGLRRCLLSVGFFLGRAFFSDPKKGESRTVEAMDKNLKKRKSGGLEQDHKFFLSWIFFLPSANRDHFP